MQRSSRRQQGTARRTAGLVLGCGLTALVALAGGGGAAASGTGTDAGGGAGTPEPIGLTGTPVQGSTDPASPTELTAGTYTDTLGPATSAGSAHQYSYQRTMADSFVMVGVVGASSDVEGDGLSVTVSTPEGTECASDDAQPSFSVPQQSFGATVWLGTSEPGTRDAECLRAEELRIEVSRGLSESETDMPVMVRVVEEAPVPSGYETLPKPPEDARLTRPDVSSEAEQVDGGTAYGAAPELASGTTYADRVPEGGERLYRVSLDWGQSLAVRVDLDAMDAATAERIQFSEPTVDLQLVDPMGFDFGGDFDSEVGDATWSSQPALLLLGTLPVAWLNRFEVGQTTYPGDYWISVAVSPAPEDREPLEVPVEITAVVEGGRSGVPSFTQDANGPAGAAGPEDYAPETPYLVDEGQFVDVVASPGVLAEEGPSITTRLVGMGLAVASAGCCGAGIFLLRRRTRA